MHYKKCWSSIKLKNADESQSGLYKCVEETGKVVKVYEVEVVGKLAPEAHLEEVCRPGHP